MSPMWTWIAIGVTFFFLAYGLPAVIEPVLDWAFGNEKPITDAELGEIEEYGA